MLDRRSHKIIKKTPTHTHFNYLESKPYAYVVSKWGSMIIGGLDLNRAEYDLSYLSRIKSSLFFSENKHRYNFNPGSVKFKFFLEERQTADYKIKKDNTLLLPNKWSGEF